MTLSQHARLESRIHRLALALALPVALGTMPALGQTDLDLEDLSADQAAEGESSGKETGHDATLEPYPETVPVRVAEEAPVVEKRRAPARTIEEIVVTAQKRESSIQDAPFAISAMTGEDLERRAVSGAADLQFQVPGMNVSEASNATLISIRGVGSNVDSGATEPAVAVHIDGVYQPRPSTGPLGLNDLERVEVLKGPQGTLYGRNSTGGVVNYILRKPTATFESTLKAGMASFGKRSAFGILSGPLVEDQLNGRLMLEWDTEDGWVKDRISGEMSDARQGYGARTALQWLPADSLTVDLSLLYRYDEGRGLTPRDVCLAPPNTEAEARIGVVPPTNPDDCLQNQPHERKISRLPDGERETLNGALTAVWELDAFSLKSVTGYQEHEFTIAYDVDSMARDILFVQRKNDRSEAMSEELTAFGTLGDLQWLVGAYYFDSEYIPDLWVRVPQLAGGTDVFLRERGTTQSLAAFTDLTYSITDTVRVGGGLRVLRDEKKAWQTNQYEVAGGLVPLPGSVPGVLTECENLPLSLHFDKLTPKLVAQWDVLDAVTAYANYSAGFQSGGTNFSACGDTYEPEKNIAVELGIKSSWFDRRVTANASVFQTDYTNFQVLKIEGVAANVINAPKAKIRGGDLELNALLTEQLVTNFALSVLDAKYVEFCDNDPVNPSDAPPEPGCSGTGEKNLSGVEMARSPNYTLNVGAEYTWNLPYSLASTLRLRGEWFKAADQAFRPFGAPEDRQESYSIVNGFVSMTSADEKLELRLYGKNLENTEYFLFKIGNSFGQRYGTAGEPRRLGVDVVYRF